MSPPPSGSSPALLILPGPPGLPFGYCLGSLEVACSPFSLGLLHGVRWSARGSQEGPGGAGKSQEELGGARRSQAEPRRSPGRPKRSQKEPGEARRKQFAGRCAYGMLYAVCAPFVFFVSFLFFFSVRPDNLPNCCIFNKNSTVEIWP